MQKIHLNPLRKKKSNSSLDTLFLAFRVSIVSIIPFYHANKKNPFECIKKKQTTTNKKKILRKKVVTPSSNPNSQ